MLKIQANKDGVVQFSSAIQKGDLIDANEELVALIPEIDKKKLKFIYQHKKLKGLEREIKFNMLLI